MNLGVWFGIIIAFLAGFLVCFTTVTAYIWRSRWQEGFHRGLTGYKRVNGTKQ